jgi:hypothetical protein
MKLMFRAHRFAKFSKGNATAVFLESPTHTLGIATIICIDTGRTLCADIIEIRKVRFGDLGLRDAASAGYNTVNDLRQAVQQIHRRLIGDYETVHIFRFKLEA